MQGDLLKIKKKYGEDMAHLCRELFPTLLEQDNLLYSILDSKFDHSKILYEDIIKNDLQTEFQNYILKQNESNSKLVDTNLTPFDLMDKAGYNLYECKSEKDILKFKKYYIEDEELCTFYTDRLSKCDVFFAVKKDINKIKREDFPEPKRQDKYGTSVISIQFTKDKHVLSIKNRYNHSVNNPDATYSNNLENIILGLTKSFQNYLNYEIKYDEGGFDIPNYVYADKYYRYNFERDNIYYCFNNVIVDNGKVIKLDPCKYLLLDYFIFDLENKKIKQYHNFYDFQHIEGYLDGFIDSVGKINNIEIIKKNDNKIMLINNAIKIEFSKYNNIIGYINNNVEIINDHFLRYIDKLKYIKIDNVKSIGNYFLYSNNIDYINLDKVKFIGDNFMQFSDKIESISLPDVKKIGHHFMAEARLLRSIKLNNIIEISHNFLAYNNCLKFIYAPKLKTVDFCFLKDNTSIKNLYLPSLISAGISFLRCNKSLESIYVPSLEIINNNFLEYNKSLKEIKLPSIKIIEDGFLEENENIDKHLLIENNNIKRKVRTKRK